MLTTTQTLGYRSQPTGRCEYLTMAFSPLNTPLRSRWRNNGLSADFLGDYVITFLPADAVNPATERLQNEIKHAVTYIANELLENAMKYHDHQVNIPIGILLELAADPHPLVRLIAQCALTRTESRGAHQRRDFPDRDSRFDAEHVTIGAGREPVLQHWK